MGKHLLICGSGNGMEHTLNLVRDLVSEITIITDRPDDAEPFVDRVIEVYPRSESDVLNAIEKFPNLKKPDAVLSLGYENSPVISKVASLFGCRHLPYEVALNATHKNRRIEILSKAGINVPKYEVGYGLENGLSIVKKFGVPCVVKPNDKSSSIGVSVIRSLEAVESLVQHASTSSESGTVVVEEFLNGSEHSIEGLISEGKVYFTAFGDRNYSEKHKFAPFVFENGDNLPSQLRAEDKAKLYDVTMQAIKALKLDNTVFKGDLLLRDNGVPYVLELIPRLSGAGWGTELIPLSTGVQILRNAVRLALGDEINTEELKETVVPNKHVVARFLPNIEGVIAHIGDISQLKNKENIYDARWEAQLEVGQVLSSYRSGKDMIASVTATGKTFAEAEVAALEAIKKIPITVKPLN